MADTRGQFYIIAAVFVFIALSALFAFTLFVEFGSQTLPSQSMAEFQNLENAIQQRNNWLPTYWFDFNWRTKSVVNITAYNNPTEFDAGITANCDSVRVFDSSGVEIISNITSTSTPCNVTINFPTGGIYSVYWNGTNVDKSISTGIDTTYSYSIVQAPEEGICSHFNSILPRKNIAFNCSAVNNTNTYNYSVSFTATDFTYVGNLT